MSVLLEFSIFPTDQGESVSGPVSEVIRMIAAAGVDYQLTAMGTLIETDTVAGALAIVEQAADLLDAAGCRRIYASMKLDIRNGSSGRLAAKVAAIQTRIGEVSH